MQIDGKYKKAYLTSQHRFRGLVAAFKSKRFEKNARHGHSFIFRRGYRELMLEARAELHPSQFSDYLQWCSFHIQHQLPELKRYPTGYDELQGVASKNPKVSLEREILWIAARVRENHLAINLFREVVKEIERCVMTEDIPRAIELLISFDQLQGVSFWSVQLRIALEAAAGGLEGQKKYTAEVRSIYKAGLLNFIAYNTSVRNEDRVSVQKYMDDISQRIFDHSKYDDSVKCYMRHRLMGEWSADNNEISDVLRVEQSHSLVDVYETFVSLVQYSLSCEKNDELVAAIKLALTHLECIKDYRISKACIVYGIPVNTIFPIRDSRIIDALCASEISAACLMARNPQNLNNSLIDAWDYIHSGVALSLIEYRCKKNTLAEIHHLIAKILRQSYESQAAYSYLLKLVTNLRGLPIAGAIHAFIQTIYKAFPDQDSCPWLISINCPTLGFEDKGFLGVSKTAGSECWQLLDDYEKPIRVANGVAVEIFRSCGMVNAGEWDLAIQTLRSVRCVAPSILPAMVTPLVLHALYAAGLRQSVIELIADEGTQFPSRAKLLAINNALKNYTPEDYGWAAAITECNTLTFRARCPAP